MSAIQQLQMRYSPEEDRVLLRINTTGQEEFRFWLTRRYCGLIIQALNAHRSADPDVTAQSTPVAKKAVEAFKQEAANAEGNFEQAFQEAKTYPLGEHPALAQRLKYSIDSGLLALTIEPKEGRGITIKLDAKLNFNVSKLLGAAIATGEWQLEMDQTALEAPQGVVDRVIN
ncbi:MAG: hypothetical protein JJ921_17515 [Pseudomonadales bacterium]|nr:hypothetical protein [Pseudomonadales bacterium]MBO7006047.1 hypothetical protein [Pseudomonadales bacterium]